MSKDFAERAQRLNRDFRTPIGTIATALDLLRAGNADFDESDLEALRILERQVDKLTTLAESLRSLAEEMALSAH